MPVKTGRFVNTKGGLWALLAFILFGLGALLGMSVVGLRADVNRLKEDVQHVQEVQRGQGQVQEARP